MEFDVHVDGTEQDFVQLGKMRELAVRLALVDLEIFADETYPAIKINPEPPLRWGPGRDNDVKRVDIQLSALC